MVRRESGIPRSDYHSAHAVPVVEFEPREEFRIAASIAFRHDVIEGLPQHYQFCEAVYADLPWQSGFDEFNNRAGVTGRTYKDFMRAVSEAVEQLTQPVALVTGKHAARSLPNPQTTADLMLNQYDSRAYLYNVDSSPWKTATDLLVDWSDTYGSVGDFCCGYGRALKIFHRKGKPWVGTDFNPYCIGYVAAHAREW